MIEDFDPVPFTISETSKLLKQQKLSPLDAQTISFHTIQSIINKMKGTRKTRRKKNTPI